MLRLLAGLAIVAALVAALAFALVALTGFLVLVAIGAMVASLLGADKRRPGPRTIEGEVTRVDDSARQVATDQDRRPG